MSRKPYFPMSRQGRKEIKNEMAQTAQTHVNIGNDDNHTEENVSYPYQEIVQPIEENEFDNIDPGSFPHHSNSPPNQQSSSPFENYSVYHNLFDEHPLSDSDYENQVNPVDINDSFINNLRHWALKYQVTHTAINALLSILKNYKCFDLPADARSLLKTPENVITRVVEPEQTITEQFQAVPEVIDADIGEFTNDVPIDRSLAVNYPTVTSKTQAKDVTTCVLGCPSKQFGIQQSHLIQVVTDLAKQIVDLNRKVDVLLGKHTADCNAPTEDNIAISELLSSLLVEDDASFCHFNEQLQISLNKQAVMSFLADIGGRNIRSLTTNILRRVLQDDVAELYSLTGKQMKNSNKKSFLKTDTCKMIFQICKKVYDDATEDNVKEIISDWLNQAKVTTKRRAERLNNNKSASVRQQRPSI